jgi:DNA-binding response OmpR family regulator
MNHILIIEDEYPIAMGLEALLTSENYSVTVCTDGENGLNTALELLPDAILLDINLPLINGFDVCRKLRELNFINPILLITSKVELVDKILGLEIGADDYITKPFNSRELLCTVKVTAKESRKNR